MSCHIMTSQTLPWQVVAVIGLSYDVSMQLLGTDETGCGEIFHHNQTLYSIVFGTFMVSQLLHSPPYVRG